MKRNIAQHQRLLQKLILTPQMKLSLKLLTMSTKDLNEYIDSVLEINPFLRKELQPFKKSSSDTHRGKADSGAYEYIENINRQEESPHAHLLAQLRLSKLEGTDSEIAEYLIYAMDQNGYITMPMEDVADEFSVPVEQAESCLDVIQGFEPAGIGARDIRECLQLQLRRLGRAGSLEYAIVTDHIEELARSDAKHIAKAAGSDEKSVNEAISNIKKLNPKPGSALFGKPAEYVVPDFVVTAAGKKLTVELNRGWMPRLQIHNPYEESEEINEDHEAGKFLKENLATAKDMIETLKRREVTLCSVADYIINYHRDTLLEDGKDYKSLTIKDVASALDLHTSTISRAVSNKYIELNGSVIPLNSLLSHAVKKMDGETISKISIKNRLRELLKNEERTDPLSDADIQSIFLKEGIDIKRRTIAKYRQALRILPSHLRRKR